MSFNTEQFDDNTVLPTDASTETKQDEIIANQTDGTQKTQLVDAGGDIADIIDANGEKGLVTISPGHISTGNSTSTPLLADGVFTGISEEVTNFGVIIITVKSDVASATDGLSIQQSTDGTNWDCTDAFTIPANTSKVFSFQTCARYFRVVYTNGGSDQTYLRLQSIIKPYYVKPSSHRINDAIIGEDDAELVKAVLTGLAPDGAFKNVLVTNAGNQKVSIEEFENSVSTNSNTQLRTTLYDEDGYFAGVDGTTNTLKNINYEHAEIHSGDHFNYCDYDISPLGASDTIEFILTTPDTTRWTHFTFDLYSSEGATIELYEGASGITGGTTITPRNNNRNSDTVSTITLLKDPTAITGDGTRAAGFLAGSGKNAGFVSREKENVLKQNETYLLRITSLAASNEISWCAEWYEHAN